MSPRRLAQSLVATLCLAASPALADDPYGEYRIPEHYWRSWTGSASAGGRRDVSDSFGHAESGNLSGNGSSRLTGGFDSDARSHAYSLTLALSGNKVWRDLDQDIFGDEDHGHNKQASQSLTGFLAYSRYPTSIPIGLSLAANGAFSLSQSWVYDDRTTNFPPSKRQSKSDASSGGYDAGAGLTASLSLGRVRDATPVYQVQVLEQRLLDAGTITHALSSAGRERLAALYTVQLDVAFAHQRPTKYFWQELERILRDDGVLGEGGLDAYSVQRLLEPLTIVGSGPAARARGIAFGPVVMLSKQWSHSSSEGTFSEKDYDHDTLVTSYELSVDQLSDFHSDTIFSGLFAEYHRPFGMRWQVDAVSRALIPEYGKVITWTNQAGVNWLVADRWFATAAIQHGLTAPGHGTERRPQTWSVDYGASVNYFLEDAWAFGLRWAGHQESKFGFERRDSFSLGVTYQFAGWLTAPAVFAPMRLSPPAR